ncbi:L-ornithine N(5)-monooxygenase [Colletotrichum fructicola]|nr:L-ornithine [Colletotrichum fructicola]KAF4823369.1 L-ornithine N(5)-monooxygenase [Colletotrichum siamense]KAI8151141.1 L-ornithine [Colletotrichum sp. SAR 10_65]KAI8162478.1 L-ornithine [Colletotrichum sp. SAR 10_71]KAI8182248.1 L-ornithine [Colletotrichum sp. SAR 10_70]KAI8183374.1 L-ornithine [Colletotrichum sp. SAR 10_75]KAI8195654.1 L-ornithine [Colletotrichum sp. SAR 10_76]KAI8231658.1 L-ornithine [Colletotrichum sp. SAR 10_86]KAI8249112.1 L-ornithine [Colletotrichum sp. SAR 10_77
MSPHCDSPTNGSDAGSGFSQYNGNGNAFANGNGAVHQNGNGVNGHSNGIQSIKQSPYLLPTDPSEIHDLICCGFGPASLAVAVSINDAQEAGRQLTGSAAPKVLFLEKQPAFAWHPGMLLSGAKMQISFIKDMASLRNPRSQFTFLNYLHCNNRLVEFTNLDTFLPARAEYEDYLRWCASHFNDVVEYGREVVSISPDPATEGGVKVWTVKSRNVKTGQVSSYRTRNVLIANGGQANIPKVLPAKHPKIIHSSQYAQLVPQILKDNSRPYRVAVIGAGQSAAEIFRDIHRAYPNSKTWMVMRSNFLKPADDSPFVNSIFNPSYVDELHPKSQAYRRSLIKEAKATNYGVVRLQLIDHLYEMLYHQKRLLGVDERKWPHRMLFGRNIVQVNESKETERLQIHVRSIEHSGDGLEDGFVSQLPGDEILDVDLIVAATGYQRSAHIDMLRDTWSMLPELTPASNSADREIVDGWEISEGDATSGSRKLEVGRDYRVRFAPGTVAPEAGVYLQGCNEMTHGLSDTLLSILSVRSSEIVDSIFSTPKAKAVSN